MSIKLSASSGLLRAQRIEGAARTLARLGYDGIEIWAALTMPPYEHGPEARARLRTLCSSLNLAIIGTHGVLPSDGHRFTCNDPEERQRGIAYMKAVIDMTADLGGSVVTVGAPAARNRPPDVTPEVSWQRVLDAYAIFADHAAPLGIRVTAEVVNRYEADSIRTMDEGMVLVRALDRSNLGLTPDTYHMNIDEGPYAAAIQRTGKHIFHMHAGDNNRQAPGEGTFDFYTVARALKDIGYDGFWSLELFEDYYGIRLNHTPEEALARGLAYLRKVIGDVYA